MDGAEPGVSASDSESASVSPRSGRPNSVAASGWLRPRPAVRNALAALALLGLGLTWVGVWVGRDLPSIDQIAFLKAGADAPSHAQSARGVPAGRFLRMSEISHWVPRALIAAEDRHFYSHFGVDPRSLVRAFLADLRAGRIVQGGSTITEQLAKNLLPLPGDRLHQKLQEMVLAIELERRFTKRQILQFYLNRVYFGSGAYGIDAASQLYFHEPAKDLTLYQSAVLVGLLPAPSRFNPRRNKQLAARRAAVILNDMVETGALTEQQAKQAIAAAGAPSVAAGGHR